MTQRVFFLVLATITCCSSLGAKDQANEALIKMVVGFLADSDKDIRSLAFDQIRNAAPGEAATKRFAANLPKLSTTAQIGLLGALADRGDKAAKPAVLELLDSRNDPSLRAAAMGALGKLGDATDCPKLIGWLSEGDDSIKKAAREALVQIRGKDVSTEIATAIPAVVSTNQIALIEILTSRRALDTIPTLLELAVGKDQKLRAAAMASLGQLAGPEHVGGMTAGVLQAAKGAERAAAEKNLMFVCNRIEDRESRAQPLLEAMKKLSNTDRIAMLSTLGRIGGKPALLQVEKAISSRNSALHSAGLRAISNWPDASVAQRLIVLAKSDKHVNHRRTARMALIRIAPLPDGRTDAEKLELLQTAMKMATSDAERNYALKRAAAIRLPETLRFILPYADQSQHAQQACQSIVELAHHRKLRDDNKTEFHAALDKVIATTKDAVVIDRANRYKKGQTWLRPK